MTSSFLKFLQTSHSLRLYCRSTVRIQSCGMLQFARQCNQFFRRAFGRDKTEAEINRFVIEPTSQRRHAILFFYSWICPCHAGEIRVDLDPLHRIRRASPQFRRATKIRGTRARYTAPNARTYHLLHPFGFLPMEKRCAAASLYPRAKRRGFRQPTRRCF